MTTSVLLRGGRVAPIIRIMEWKLLGETDGQRTWMLVFDIDDEVLSGIEAFAAEQDLGAARVTGIGALREAVVAFWDWDSKEYLDIPVPEQVEVLSLIGNIAQAPNRRAMLHAHVVLSRRDGSTIGGHLRSGRVRPTLEIMVTDMPATLQRSKDATTGLTLLDL